MRKWFFCGSIWVEQIPNTTQIPAMHINQAVAGQWGEILNQANDQGFARDHLKNALDLIETFLKYFKSHQATPRAEQRAELLEILEKHNYRPHYPARHKLLKEFTDGTMPEEKFLQLLLDGTAAFLGEYARGIDLSGLKNILQE